MNKERNARVLLATGLLVILACDVSAQRPTFDRLSVEHGLSQSAVFDVMRDDAGFLWAGTQDGLNRFDGHRFVSWHHDAADSTSLSNSWTTAIEQTMDGTFWIGTQGGGLNRMDPATGVFTTVSTPHPVVTDLEVDARDVLWIGTYGGLLALETTALGDSVRYFAPEPERPTSLPAPRVLTLAVHPNGSVWVGTDRGGLAVLDPETGVFTRIPLGPSPADIILSLYVDADLSVWVGTAGAGLFRVSDSGNVIGWVQPGAGLALPAQAGRINSISRDANGDLWAGTDGAGMLRADASTMQFTERVEADGTEHGLPAGTVTKLLTDTSGILWVGTNGGGLGRARAFGMVSSAVSVMSVAELNGVVWMGTDGAGLVGVERRTGQRWTLGPEDGLPHGRVLGLAVDEDDLWVGTGGGLARYTPGTGVWEVWTMQRGLTDNRVFATAGPGDGGRWVATWQGLDRLDMATSTLTPIPGLSNNRAIDVFEASTGTLWVGTLGGGLNRKDRGATGFEHVALSDNIVASIAEASDGTIWAGTASGLNRLDPMGSRVYTTANGLPNNTVYGVVEGDDGRMWMSTNRGLAALAPDTGDITTFDITDGLQNNEFNQGAVFRTAEGALLFGGISGVTRFHPSRIMRPVDQRVELTSVSTDRWTVPVTALPETDRVRVTPEDGTVRVGFTSTDLRNPDRTTFRWRLRGETDQWTQLGAGERVIPLNRLPGGTWHLEIEAHGDIRTLVVDVVPPFWATTWFRVLMALAFLGITFVAGGAVYRKRLQRAEANERARTEIHERLMQSRESERLRLAQELHDGAMQDLYGVRYRLTDDTGPMVQDVITKLREICGELRPSVLAPFGLERAIRAFMDTIAERHPSLAIRLDLDVDGQAIPEEPRLALYRIVQESVHNVIKHADATTLDVTFRLDGRRVALTIRDNGRGFTPPTSWLELGREGHYGLLGLSERVRALGGRLDVQSEPGSGTHIHVEIP